MYFKSRFKRLSKQKAQVKAKPAVALKFLLLGTKVLVLGKY